MCCSSGCICSECNPQLVLSSDIPVHVTTQLPVLVLSVLESACLLSFYITKRSFCASKALDLSKASLLLCCIWLV